MGPSRVVGIEYGLAYHLGDLTPASAQTLSFLSNELFLVVIGGGLLFALPSGLAILRGAALLKWLGWVGVVLGICFVIPFLIFPALLGTLVWTVIVSILVYLRSGSTASATAEAPQGWRPFLIARCHSCSPGEPPSGL